MRSGLILCATLLGSLGTLRAEPSFIAGSTPDRRPEGAPRIEVFVRDAGWWERFTFGISRPLPPNLGAESQGAWYTPFNRPGMLPPYDLRGWHEITPSRR
jgi:hypothetical protein